MRRPRHPIGLELGRETSPKLNQRTPALPDSESTFMGLAGFLQNLGKKVYNVPILAFDNMKVGPFPVGSSPQVP